MSENETPEVAVEPKKKKKGKLPVLLALVAVLGGGGFFAMKMKGGAAKEKVALGEIVPLEQEFLSNLKDKDTYVRAKIALHLQKDFEKTHLAEKMPALEDAIYMILSDKSLNEVRSVEGKNTLKREIAAAINQILESHEPKDESKSKEPREGDEKSEEPEKPTTLKHPDWDSESGPVLKVYFQSFATQ